MNLNVFKKCKKKRSTCCQKNISNFRNLILLRFISHVLHRINYLKTTKNPNSTNKQGNRHICNYVQLQLLPTVCMTQLSVIYQIPYLFLRLPCAKYNQNYITLIHIPFRAINYKSSHSTNMQKNQQNQYVTVIIFLKLDISNIPNHGQKFIILILHFKINVKIF